MLAAFPVINAHQGVWCIPYLLSGIILSLSLSHVYFKYKNNLIIRRKVND